jgi:hypothetical protein
MLFKMNKLLVWKILIISISFGIGCSFYPKKSNVVNHINAEYEDCIVGMCINELSKISYDSALVYFTPRNLSKVGPINYVKYLSNFQCYDIEIPSCRFPENWVKKENLNSLIKIANDKTPCPNLHMMSVYSYTVDLDSALTPSSTVGRESLRLINSYFVKAYPCSIVYSLDSIMKMKNW